MDTWPAAIYYITGPRAVADGLHGLLTKAGVSADTRVEEFVGYWSGFRI
jgi:hypothetical protein